MSRAVPVLCAILFSLGLTGCPGSLDPSLAGGTTGSGGSSGTGCDITPLLSKYNCTTAGCHDNTGTAAKFDMASPNLAARLVGVKPPGGGQLPSQCMADNIPYLVPGSNPATGLLLDKINKTGDAVCGDQMPTLGPKVTASPADLDCFQKFANAAVAAAGSTGAGGSSGGGDMDASAGQ